MLDITNLFPVAIPKGFLESSVGTIVNNPNAQFSMTPETLQLLFQCIDTVHIVQIGAGGTGGYVASNILRQLGNMHPVIQDKIYYWLMDGDEFEAKNMGRQLCTEDDLGENKAEVLINNYGEFFGCKMDHIFAIPEYLTGIEQLIDCNAIPSYTQPFAPDIVGLVTKPKQHTRYKCDAWQLGTSLSVEDIGEYKRISTTLQLTSRIPCYNSAFPIIIFIDCVDKNAPRKIIHDYMQQYKQAESSYQNDQLFRRSLAAGMRIGSDALRKYNLEELLEHHNHLISPRDIFNLRKSLGSNIYLISSGNAQYTGQVYWGRMSQFFCSQPATTYADVMELSDPKEYTLANVLDNMANYHRDGSKVLPPLYLNRRVDEISEEGYVTRYQAMPDIISENPNYFKSLFMSVPTPYERFPELLDLEADKAEEAMSCAERAAQNVQNITANQTAATLVNNYLTAILRGIFPMKDTDRTILTTAGVNFDVNTNVFTSEYLTKDYLQLK